MEHAMTSNLTHIEAIDGHRKPAEDLARRDQHRNDVDCPWGGRPVTAWSMLWH